MKRELLELASDLARRGEPFALATVVARTPPISAHVGDAALVTGDGAFHGWVGGSCTRPTVIAEALEALRDSRPRLVALDPNPESRRRPGLTVFPMTCHSGGSVEIHIQPVLPPPRGRSPHRTQHSRREPSLELILEETWETKSAPATGFAPCPEA